MLPSLATAPTPGYCFARRAPNLCCAAMWKRPRRNWSKKFLKAARDSCGRTRDGSRMQMVLSFPEGQGLARTESCAGLEKASVRSAGAICAGTRCTGDRSRQCAARATRAEKIQQLYAYRDFPFREVSLELQNPGPQRIVFFHVSGKAWKPLLDHQLFFGMEVVARILHEFFQDLLQNFVPFSGVHGVV